jgi:CPA2 family monovalent cation:H+ antiporter-2
MLATQTMLQLGMPLEKVLVTLREVRRERYQLMPGFFHGATDADMADTAQARLHTMVVPREAACVGKLLKVLNLAMLGVRVTAIRRPATGPVRSTSCLRTRRLRCWPTRSGGSRAANGWSRHGCRPPPCSPTKV